jgi:DNA-directed RNA polymerase subunit RPC12/RpoP
VVVLAVILAAVLMFFGIIFLIASVYEPSRIITGSVLVLVGLLIPFYIYITRPRSPTRYQVDLPADIQTKVIKCPQCSASVPMANIKIVSGITYINCPYCGTSSQLSEEPKW